MILVTRRTVMAGALVLARVDRVVYGCSDPKAGAVVSLFEIGRDTRLNHRLTVEGGGQDQGGAGRSGRVRRGGAQDMLPSLGGVTS